MITEGRGGKNGTKIDYVICDDPLFSFGRFVQSKGLSVTDVCTRSLEIL